MKLFLSLLFSKETLSVCEQVFLLVLPRSFCASLASLSSFKSEKGKCYNIKCYIRVIKCYNINKSEKCKLKADYAKLQSFLRAERLRVSFIFFQSVV